MPMKGAHTAIDLEPLIRATVRRWVDREGLAVLDNEIHRLSESIAMELLEKYAFPRAVPSRKPHPLRPGPLGGPRNDGCRGFPLD